MNVVEMIESDIEDASSFIADNLTFHETALIILNYRKNKKFISLLYAELRYREDYLWVDNLEALSFRSVMKELIREIDVKMALGREFELVLGSHGGESNEKVRGALREICGFYMKLFPDAAYICDRLESVKTSFELKDLYWSWYCARSRKEKMLEELKI